MGKNGTLGALFGSRGTRLNYMRSMIYTPIPPTTMLNYTFNASEPAEPRRPVDQTVSSLAVCCNDRDEKWILEEFLDEKLNTDGLFLKNLGRGLYNR